jgi:Domain of unknown function (DUF305)
VYTSSIQPDIHPPDIKKDYYMNFFFPARSHTRLLAAFLASAACAFGNACFAAGNDEKPFLSENDTAMNKMMDGMAIKPSGDVDHDFVGMMVPHHQGAIDMAQAELRYGHNEQLRRIAQEIIVEQQQEIAAMRLALGQPLPPSVASPDQPAAASPAVAAPMSHHSMSMHKEP